MPIGGDEDKLKVRRILNKFMTLAGGVQANIAILLAAKQLAGRVDGRDQALFCKWFHSDLISQPNLFAVIARAQAA